MHKKRRQRIQLPIINGGLWPDTPIKRLPRRLWLVLLLIILPVSIYATGTSPVTSSPSKQTSTHTSTEVTDNASLAPWVKFSNDKADATKNDQYDDMLTRTVTRRAGRNRVVSGNIWHRVC